MERPRIAGEIINIQSYEDGGEIFEQNYLLKMADKTILKIFDPDILIRKEMIGKTEQATLTVFLPQIQTISRQEKGLISDYTTSNIETHLPMIFKGRIEQFNEKRNRFTLDIGVGMIDVLIHAFQAENLNFGDFVEIESYRIDLDSLYSET